MSARRAILSLIAATLLLLPAAGAPGVETTSSTFKFVLTAIQVDGKEVKEARLFVNAEKTVYFVCLPGDPNVYRVDSKAKKVAVVKRSTLLVQGERCRPIEGSKEMPITGHLYAETADGFTFNALDGHKISVAVQEPRRESK